MKKLDGFTADIVAERIEELKTVFPEIFKDGKIDFDSLQNILGEHIEDAREKYSFTWAGKLDSIRLAQKRSNGTLRPCKEESVNFDTTQNLYIEGDNLEVLKLLSGSYMNSVKMIYIDPPYNTGNDFVYTDNFSDSIENYKKIIGETAKSNAETAGRYHTNWLNMMLPRLKLARVLLKQDGVIFISIDDNEQANLKKLCDEVFGEDNFIAQVVWKRKRGRDNSARWFSKAHEYLFIYTKNKEYFDTNFLELDEETKGAYKNPDNDTRGDYRMLGVWARGTQGGVKYDFINKEGQYFKERLWLMSKENLTKADKENRLIIRGDNIYRKLFITENQGKIPETVWDNVSNAANAADEIKKLFGDIIFDTPKPIPYIQEMLRIATDKDSIVLDFFSGSGTIAHSVMQLNAEDGGRRKFICVQIPELTDEKSEAYKAGYKNLCEIGKERIRRAGKKISEDIAYPNKEKNGVPLTSHGNIYTRNISGEKITHYVDQTFFEAESNSRVTERFSPACERDKYRFNPELIDIGFKVFKLDASNLKKWNNSYTRDYEQIAMRIKGYYDYLQPDRTPLDLVYEIMLKYSLPLTLPVTEVETAGVTAHIITHTGDETTDPYKVLVCMQEDLTIEQMEALSEQGCDTLFFADRCFTDTNAMTNCDEIIKKAGQEMRLF